MTDEEKQMNDSLKGPVSAPSALGLPEAGASVTYSLVTPNGFPVLFTLRENSGKSLLSKMTALEKNLVEEKFTPQPLRNNGFPKKEVQYVEGKKCPKCGGRLVKKLTKDGKEYHTCENYKYDFTTKTNIGTCSFVDWLNQGTEEKREIPTTF